VLAALACALPRCCAGITDRPWAAVAWFAAALLAKEECAAFPLLLAMLPARPRGRPHIAVMLGLARCRRECASYVPPP